MLNKSAFFTAIGRESAFFHFWNDFSSSRTNWGPSLQPVGYEHLRRTYDVRALPYFRATFIGRRSHSTITVADGQEEHVLTHRYDPGPDLGAQLEFAIKHEGVALEILAAVFDQVSPKEMVKVVKAKPTGQYRRRLWYLYELLTGREVPLPSLTSGTYVPVLPPSEFYTASPRSSARQRVWVNLLGDRAFCPVVRRSEKLADFERLRLDLRARETLQRYPDALLARAVSYLYTKETKSSFRIEREEPDARRSADFVALLRLAERESFASKQALVNLHRAIVDPRFAASDYRDFQNYVGETVAFGRELVHYVPPQPGHVEDMMRGLLAVHDACIEAKIDPVVSAALVGFGFVFIHPFEDGNGRIHRFLIHNVLARTGYSPPGVIFPVSASILQQLPKYTETLESFSKPLLRLVEWSLDDEGRMTVAGDTSRHYRYLDMTSICERLYEFVVDTVETQLPLELDFLVHYDAARAAIRSVVEMPDRLVDLFIKLCLSNGGKLSPAKRKRHFKMLTDTEVQRMERAVAKGMRAKRGVRRKAE